MSKKEVIATSVFERLLKKLAKKFPSIKKIFLEAIENLEDKPGFGDEIQGHKDYYKVRYPNIDAKKGKSGGFRLIYYWTKDSEQVILVSIYSKTDQQEVDWESVKRSIEGAEND